MLLCIANAESVLFLHIVASVCKRQGVTNDLLLETATHVVVVNDLEKAEAI